MGQRLEWWASECDGRINAVILGTRALITLDPTINDSGRPATQIKVIPLDEASLRSARVTGHRGGPSGTHLGQQGPNAPTRSTQPGDPPTMPTTGLTQRIGHDMSGFLGQLPARAQHLMQDPFAGTSNELVRDYSYRRRGDSHNINGATLYIWGYITDYRRVTFCAGVGHGYRESAGPSLWDLTCWRLDVAARQPR
jgi:hypothetical protein